MSEPRIGVVGGTGLYAMDDLEVIESRQLTTPFGEPSDSYVLGRLEGVDVAFLPRHGKGHRLIPSELNFRANVFGFKKLGVTHLISVSAVGSMSERYRPGDVVVVDQFYDRTRHRADTFFGRGLAAHVSMAEPTCPVLSDLAASALAEMEAPHHVGGTYLCIEGPQFSTRAESLIYRQWGVDVIGMTNLQEAKLAREAEMCFVCLALITDWDCWKEDEAAVSVDGVLETLAQNTHTAQQALRRMVGPVSRLHSPECGCQDALADAIVTPWSLVPEETKDSLELLIKRYRK